METNVDAMPHGEAIVDGTALREAAEGLQDHLGDPMAFFIGMSSGVAPGKLFVFHEPDVRTPIPDTWEGYAVERVPSGRPVMLASPIRLV